MVYEPQEDTELLLEQIPNYAYGHVLDMGAGSGVLAIEAAKYATYVLAVDIDEEAVEKLRKKVTSLGIKNIAVRKSNLFSNIERDKRFNLILFNPPYLPKKGPGDVEDEGETNYDLALYGGAEGWEIIGSFLTDAHKHLEPGGVILMIFSSLTGEEKVKQLMSENYHYEKISEKSFFFERLYLYKLRLKD